jgi:hypothetical protein
MAMLTLLILSVLIIGFSVLSSSEPTIANNQLRVAQARSLAEAGVERAIWALNRGDSTALPPYDGSQLVPVVTGGNTLGGFRVTVTAGAAALRTQHHRRRLGPERHHHRAEDPSEDHGERVQPSAHHEGPSRRALRARGAPDGGQLPRGFALGHQLR